MNKPTNHRFRRVGKGGRKSKRNQTKPIRVGSRHPGASGQGSVRHPF